jgi:hypothetical protein
MKLNEWVCWANNPESGVSTWVLDDGEDLHIQTRQDVTALLDENTAQRNIAQSGWKGDGMHSVARVPLSMLHDPNGQFLPAMQEGDDRHIAKLLNDSDYGALRTKDGVL